ncbi:hypothetical protein EBOKLHFM_00132 [Klebsiella phage KP13-26]|nr:hypothetical protein EBOKLHFM_00132 [Klebsiella phage KP13-26]
MKEIRDILAVFMFAAIPITGFLAVAFLIYHDKPGWEWLLFVVVLITSGLKISTDDHDER